MSAPSSSRALQLLAVALFAALVAAGCTVPGSSRLEGPPKDLPPALHYVSADVLGFTLLDTDPESARWGKLGGDLGEVTLDSLHEDVFGSADVAGWIGDSAGVAVRELDVDPPIDVPLPYFADVDDRGKLEAFLDDAGWRGHAEPRHVDDFDFDLFVRDDDGDGGGSAAVFDDAVLVAGTDEQLVEMLEAASEYAVDERTAMREYAVEARERVAISFVFRFDLWRTQLRRPFEDDPALLEFARWATDSNTLVALRDGWIGLAPAATRGGPLRLVAASEWVPDLAPDIELRPVDRDVLDELGAGLDWAVALHDPGQQLRELVRAITIGAGQYVTEQDVPDEDERVQLLPVLDALDGDAAIGGIGRRLEAYVEGGDAADLQRVVDHAKLDASVEQDGDAVRIVAGPVVETADRSVPTFVDAGKPPRPPVLWAFHAGGGCFGPSGGWVTFDGTDELRASFAVDESRECDLVDVFLVPWIATGGPLGALESS